MKFIQLAVFLLLSAICTCLRPRETEEVLVGGTQKLVGSLFQHDVNQTRAPPTTNVLYGVMTNNKAEYQAKLQMQLETWATGFPAAGRFIAVTGGSRKLSPEELGHGIMSSECKDTYEGVPCKEFQLMQTGHARGAGWLVVLGEDNYVDTAQVEKHLATVSSTDSPTVLGIVGCKMDPGFCTNAPDMKSLCGGGGYAVNYAALRSLMSVGADKLRQEYMAGTGLQGDLVTSCLMNRRGVQLAEWPGLVGSRVMDVRTLKRVIRHTPPTYHYMTQDVMRWVHANLHGATGSVLQQLEMKAFNNGCCCWFDDKEHQQCLKDVSNPKSGSFLEGDSDLIQQLRNMYVAEQVRGRQQGQ